jgi:hypothetical protein
LKACFCVEGDTFLSAASMSKKTLSPFCPFQPGVFCHERVYLLIHPIRLFSFEAVVSESYLFTHYIQQLLFRHRYFILISVIISYLFIYYIFHDDYMILLVIEDSLSL